MAVSRLKCFILCLSTILVLASCNHNPEANNGDSSSFIPNYPYSMRLALSYTIRRSDVQETFGTPEATTENGAYQYDIWTDQDSTTVAVYAEGQFIHLAKYQDILRKADFDFVSVGHTTVEDVRKVDPYLYLLENDEGAISEHMLADNLTLTLSYEKKGDTWCVSKVSSSENDFLNLDNINSLLL